jgi:hypothetical protein
MGCGSRYSKDYDNHHAAQTSAGHEVGKELTEEQKIKIDEILFYDEPTSENKTLEDKLIESGLFSEKDFADDAVHKYVLEYFEGPTAERLEKIRRVIAAKEK